MWYLVWILGLAAAVSLGIANTLQLDPEDTPAKGKK